MILSMGHCRTALIGAFAAVLAAQPVYAASCWPQPVTEAARLQQLNVVLMAGVTRCEAGADNYRADYRRFSARHEEALGAAKEVMLARFSVGMGRAWASNAIDYMDSATAQRVTDGDSPDCGALRAMAQALADGSNDDLARAADNLIADRVITPGCTRRIARTH